MIENNNNNNLKRLNIELSALCNYKCISCPNTYMERQKGEMTKDLFFRIFNEIEGKVEKVFLWNYGEPMLNREISSILEGTRGSTTKKILSTTGSLLHKYEDLSFITALDECIISLNGLTPETYSFHQRGGSLEKVLCGLKKLQPVMKDAMTNYVLQTVVNTKNFEQIGNLKEFAKEYGFKQIVLKTFNAMDGSDATKKMFVPENKKYARYDNSGNFFTPNSAKKEPCLNWMVINWNGDVNICCWDYTGAKVMGNVNSQGVFGVWNSEKMISQRKYIKENVKYPFCVDCQNSKTIEIMEIK